MRSLSVLSQTEGRVYLSVTTPEAASLLCRALAAEGFTLGGNTPKPEQMGAVMVLNPDRTVHYPGFAGSMAFGCASSVGDQPLLRVDAEKYLTGDTEYSY